MSSFDPEHGLTKKEKVGRHKKIRRSGKTMEQYRRKVSKVEDG